MKPPLNESGICMEDIGENFKKTKGSFVTAFCLSGDFLRKYVVPLHILLLTRNIFIQKLLLIKNILYFCK